MAVSAALLAACGKVPTPVPALASATTPAATPAAVTAAPASPASTPAPAESGWDARSCGPLPKLTAGDGQARFGAKLCDAEARGGEADAGESADAAQDKTEIRFVREDAAGTTVGSYWIGNDDLSAVVSDALVGQLLGGHVVAMDLQAERGGTLLLANWTGDGFVITARDYMTGDEDSARLTWVRGGLQLSTVPEGSVRLVAGADGRFVQEALRCELQHDATGVSHSLELALGSEGNVTALHYLTTAPAGDGTANSCSVDLDAADGETDWTRGADGRQTVTFVDDDGSEGEPDSVRIEREATGYRVDFRVRPSRFCGQSMELPGVIRLARGKPACTLPQQDD